MQKTGNLEQQIQELRLTLSMFSHELRNPIALINSELQMLEASHPEISEYSGWDDILDNMEYVKDLLNELSNYNSAQKVSFTPTDISEYLRTVTATVKPTLDYLGISFETEIPGDISPRAIDRIKLRQALLNLLRNAQEAIDKENGRISFIVTEDTDNGLCISIRDNGCGIVPEKQGEIFTPFVTFKKGGTGLGLPVSKQIIEAHNGSIELISAPGQGTEFRILLG